MAKSRVKWLMKGFAELRTAPGVLKVLNENAEAMAQAAGEGYVPRPAYRTGGRGRGRASVSAMTYAACRDNAKNHTLTRVLRQRRG